MANRRMFSLDVVNTDKFLDLPISAQCLYFHLGMRADDDGFIASPKQVMRMITCTNVDIKVLVESGFIIPFESGIIVIRHWKMHNYIQSDRYQKTKYIAERARLDLVNNVYRLDTEDIQEVSNMDTQYRLSKDIVRDSIELGNTLCTDTSGILLPLVDKTEYDVPLSKIEKWKEAYPAVNIIQELHKMSAWLNSNPQRRKTRRGIDRFINSWLSKEQDKGGIYRNASRQQVSNPISYDLPQEYQEMYDKYLGNNPPSTDDPFQ